MHFGVHLPQVGRKASADAIRTAAQQAEALGYDSVWVNDHLAVPADAPYPPSPSFFEPVVTLTWAAAATARVGLGTSVLVLPLRHPVHLAKEIATLDLLSSGRVTMGVGVGWLEGEFAAVGQQFAGRGAWSDDAIATLRACWSQDPVQHKPTKVRSELAGIRTLPQPGRHIPIWVGGTSEPALRRAETLGDGWHGTALDVERTRPIVTRLKASTDADFVVSMRRSWDALADDQDDIRRELAAFADMGVDYITIEPRQRHLDDWLRAVEATWSIVSDWHSG